MHRRLSVGAVSEGQLQFHIGDEQVTLGPGALALINPETLHSCNPEPVTARSYYMLYLEIHWCVQLQQALWNTDHFIPLQSHHLDDKQLYGDFIETMQLLMDQHCELMEKEQLLTQLMAKMFCRSGAATSSQHLPPTAPLHRLKQLLSADLEHELVLADAAVQLGVNPYTLLRQFQKATGITPHAYRMNCRVEQARKLLQQGMDITETALCCGFYDQSHFHRNFKSMTTVTPGEYQRSVAQTSGSPEN